MPLEIDRLDVDEIAHQAEDLTGVIRIVRVVVQGIDGGVVDVERSPLDHIYDLPRGDGLNAGDVSVRRRNQNSARRNTAHREVQRVVDGKAASLAPDAFAVQVRAPMKS